LAEHINKLILKASLEYTENSKNEWWLPKAWVAEEDECIGREWYRVTVS
jgi:hypothetical protein